MSKNIRKIIVFFLLKFSWHEDPSKNVNGQQMTTTQCCEMKSSFLRDYLDILGTWLVLKITMFPQKPVKILNFLVSSSCVSSELIIIVEMWSEYQAMTGRLASAGGITKSEISFVINFSLSSWTFLHSLPWTGSCKGLFSPPDWAAYWRHDVSTAHAPGQLEEQHLEQQE